MPLSFSIQQREDGERRIGTLDYSLRPHKHTHTGQASLSPHTMASTAKRAPTAYLLFADSVRDAVKADLQAAANAGVASSGGPDLVSDPVPAKKVSVALVAKGIGERWGKLTDDEKAGFKTQAIARAATLVAAAAAAAEAAGGEGAPPADASAAAGGGRGGEAGAAPQPLPGASLPLSVIRRMMLVDPEVKRVSAGAARAMAAAVEAAVAALAKSAGAVAVASKRRTLKPADVVGAVRADGRWADAGCVAVLVGLVGKGGAPAAAPSPKNADRSRKAAGKRPAPAGVADKAAFFKPRARV